MDDPVLLSDRARSGHDVNRMKHRGRPEPRSSGFGRRQLLGKRGIRVAPNTLSKSVGVRPRQVSAVCDLELRPGPVLGGRSRTSGNETRTETGAVFVPKGFQEGPWFTARRRYLLYRCSGLAHQARSSRVYPAPSLAGPDRAPLPVQGRPEWPTVLGAAARTFTVISGG